MRSVTTKRRYLSSETMILTLLLMFSNLLYAASAPLACSDISRLTIIGELEYVSFVPEMTRQKARIDTGAQTSSLGIMDHILFERDGRKWIRFNIEDTIKNQLIEFERPLKRMAKIKRHNAPAIERPVVELSITLGKIKLKREFTLADRAQYNYPVLIGRNVLNHKFLVHVGQKFSSSQIREDD